MLSPPAGMLQVEQAFVFFGHPIPSLHFANIPQMSPAFPSQLQKLQFPYFFVAWIRSRGPHSTNQTHPWETKIQNGALWGGRCAQGI